MVKTKPFFYLLLNLLTMMYRNMETCHSHKTGYLENSYIHLDDGYPHLSEIVLVIPKCLLLFDINFSTRD